MAQWERDPALRRRLAYLLAAAEVAALSLSFYFIFQAYAYQASVRLGFNFSGTAMYILVIIGVALIAIGSALEGLAYLKGRPWARRALIVENVAVIGLGVLWFVHNRFLSNAPDRLVARAGLVLPLITLFPLLWPLLWFRPTPPAGGER